jgi:acyl-CoA synthetase (AMP-forming)/AMP-acid ligase II
MIRPDPDMPALLAALPQRIHAPLFARAAEAPGAVALIDMAGAWTYGQLAGAVRSAAAWLSARGVRGGDRVMIITENCREAACLLLACSLLDAWAVMVNARLAEQEVAVVAQRCTPRLICGVLTSPQTRAHAASFALAPEEIAGVGKIAAGATEAASQPEPVCARGAEQVAVLIYTSGSSGPPKGVMLSHHGLLYIAAVSGWIRSLTPADRMLGLLPISHVVGLAAVFLGTLMAGASVRFVARFSPPSLLKTLAEEPVSVVLGAPAMLSLLLDYARQHGTARAVAPHLRILSVSGAPLEPALKQEAEAFFAIPLHHAYGVTECSPTISQTRPGDERADCSVGRLLPGVEARFVGNDGADLPFGEEGELFVRTPGMMLGYFRDAERTAEVLDADGWFRTGDLVRLDDGHLTIVGRAKDLIIRFGFNVIPEEVEAVLASHPCVLRAAVLGRPSAAGEDIYAFVTPRAGAEIDVAALAQHASAQLASYKRPSRIIVVPDMPVSPTGKVMKRQLLAALPEAA